MKAPMTGWHPPGKKGGDAMTDYEIIMIVLSMLEILILFGDFVVALLRGFRKKDKKQK